MVVCIPEQRLSLVPLAAAGRRWFYFVAACVEGKLRRGVQSGRSWQGLNKKRRSFNEI